MTKAHDRCATDPDVVARIMVQIVRETIRMEAHKPDRTIGMGINAAIVTETGVQFYRHPL